MIARVIQLSLRYRAAVIAASVLLAWWGIYSLHHTPVDAIPDLSENQVIVFTDWMGHGPPEVEDQITFPLMEHLQGIKGVHTVRSSSDVNFSMIHVVFEEGVDVATARHRVQEQLQRAVVSLPETAQPYLAPEAPATGQIFWYILKGDGYDLGELRSIQDFYVRGQLASIPGVAEVASVGGYAQEYHLEVDPLKLPLYGVTLGQIVQAVNRDHASVGGHVVQKAGQEYVIRSPGWFGVDEEGRFSTNRAVADLEKVQLSAANGDAISLHEVCRISLGPGPRRGVLEMDGNEVTGGVVMMRFGENPLELTHRIREKIQQLRTGLPPHVQIVSGYDRTPLIHGAVGTVTRALMEAVLTSVICVLVVMLHVRGSVVIAVTLPLATLSSFAAMWTLRQLGIADIQTNMMSLAGLAISIGVLVDSSIVMTENVMHHLRNQFGDQPVRGDIRAAILPACQAVGRPIFFSVMIMLLSFLPVFVIGGSAGKMFRPLVFTKTFALAAVAILAVTLVPALCSFLIKGRLRREEDSRIVRTFIEVYRPLLNYLLDHPAVVYWIVGVTFLVGVAPLGSPWTLRLLLGAALLVCGWSARSLRSRVAGMASLVVVALVAQNMSPLENETNFITPLEEGTVMDMPITIPRVSLAQATDDLKARDMMLCRFPEVEMVMGKAGRAETPTDPAPVDMIETMVSLRPRDHWPRRKMANSDTRRIANSILDQILAKGLIEVPPDRMSLIDQSLEAVMPRFDAQMREYAYHRNQQLTADEDGHLLEVTVQEFAEICTGRGALNRVLSESEIATLAAGLGSVHGQHHGTPTEFDIQEITVRAAAAMERMGWVQRADDLLSGPLPLRFQIWDAVLSAMGRTAPSVSSRLRDRVAAHIDRRWRAHVQQVNEELVSRGAGTIVRLFVEDLLLRAPAKDEDLMSELRSLQAQRENPPRKKRLAAGHHDSGPIDVEFFPIPAVDDLQSRMTKEVAGNLVLWRASRDDLGHFGGEMDLALQMPGWANVWTRPIQNRVDMLNTGVNSTTVAIRVLGRSVEDVIGASESIAAMVKEIPGAANVIADPIRGKGFLEIHIDRNKAAALQLNVGEIQDLVQAATGGTLAEPAVEGRARRAIRVGLSRRWREDEERLRKLPIALSTRRDSSPAPLYTTLEQVARIETRQGSASIKGENGLLRNYVRLDVRGRDAGEFVEQAKQVLARGVQLPPGVYLEWTGGFEHWQQSRQTLMAVVPITLTLILALLYWTYRDLGDALLMLVAVPAAVAGGVFLQWVFGCKFSMTVAIGYLSCFGMATATGVIMLVYLREAVDNAGGLERMDLSALRQAVIKGAVHRLRPKLLTEATTIIGLAPVLWASGVGAEVIKPMAIPVLGGILIADEVIDLFLPVAFFWVRKWRWHRLHGSTAGSMGSVVSSTNSSPISLPL